MAVKAKASSRVAAPPGVGKAPAAPAPTARLTMEERLHRIETMGKRIDGYVQFMCKIASETGTSSEIKERAVAVFYEQMVLVERQLAHIHDELRLE